MSVLTLYVLDDWLLVTVILFVIGALVWSSRNYVPAFISQSKIILNLGMIREGERIIYNGIPWQIKSLGYYCRFANPLLKGGQIRVNSKELFNYTSRSVNETEPWFITKEGDWVLHEKQLAKVIMQSQEQVIVRYIGGMTQSIQTADFLTMAPTNLSAGFAIEMIYGVDYDHQSECISSILRIFRTQFDKKLKEQLPGMVDDFKELSIDFHEAAGDSLNYRLFLKCEGKLAGQYLFLQRRLQSIYVAICNENDYVIPFKQLRLHGNIS